MPDVFSAIIQDENWWDGTTSWAGETSEANRDTKYSIRRYLTAPAWETARDGLAQAGDIEYGVVIGPWIVKDSTSYAISGFASDSTRLICPPVLDDSTVNLAWHFGIPGFNADAYQLNVSGGNGIQLNVAACHIDGIHIINTGVSSSDRCLYAVGAFIDHVVRNCILETPINGMGFNFGAVGSAGEAYNNIIFNPAVTPGASSEGSYMIVGGSWEIYHNTIYNYAQGFEQDAGTGIYKNNIVFQNTTDFDLVGTTTVDYNASDDGTGTNALVPVDWNNEFIDYTNFDFTPKVGAEIIGAGLGSGTDPNLPTTDILGNARSSTAPTMGAFEFQGTTSANPDNLVLSSIILEETTGADTAITSFFTSAQIASGFSGFFDVGSDPDQIRFSRNAVFAAVITGKEASIKGGGSGSSPYLVYVDGVQTAPVKAGAEIPLFSGELDEAHTVAFIRQPVTLLENNYISDNETQSLTVTGIAPAVVLTPFEYLSNPVFTGLSTESEQPTGDVLLTPTYDECAPYDDERGELIVNATCDTIYLYTDDVACYFSIDGASPSLVTFTETNQAAGVDNRRAVLVSDSLDDTTEHQYTFWPSEQVTYGMQGIFALKDAAIVGVSVPNVTLEVAQYGDSITYGSLVTIGESSTYIYARTLGVSMYKAGFPAENTVQVTARISDLIDFGGIPDHAVIATGQNDGGVDQTEYTALIQALLTAGVTKIICRGLLNGQAGVPQTVNNAVIAAAVASFSDTDINYVETSGWTEITYIDAIHPDSAGQARLAEYEDEAYGPLIFPAATPDDLVLSAIILEQTEATIIAVPNDLVLSSITLEETTGRALRPAVPANLVLSAIILGQTKQTGNNINLDTITTTGILTMKFTTTGDLG